jgi:hypothetical protein
MLIEGPAPMTLEQINAALTETYKTFEPAIGNLINKGNMGDSSGHNINPMLFYNLGGVVNQDKISHVFRHHKTV